MTSGGNYSRFVRDEWIQSLPNVPNGQPFAKLLLYDFDTDSHEILEQHERALQDFIYPMLRIGRVAVWVGGFASRAGSDSHNRRLSHLRARAVANRIEFRGGNLRHLKTVEFGEGQSQEVADENSGNRRAVLILLYNVPAYVEPPRPTRPHPLPFFNRFRISLLWGVEGGAALVGGDYHFLIDYDTDDRHAPPSSPCEYSLIGLGGGWGAPAGAQEGYGNWNKFSTARNCTPEDFSGRGSIGGYGINILRYQASRTLVSLFPNQLAPIHFENFQTSTSVSLGASRIYGAFFRS